jgi:glycosyltransferase involved in cell wall biosynthesis
MMKDLLLIAHFCSDFDGNGNNRFNYLANLFAENGFNVEFITSDFSHEKKKKRNEVNLGQFNYKVTLIPEPVYYKNVSLKRFYSHYILGRNLKKYLAKRKKPDIIYCAVPSLDIGKVVAEFAEENNIRFVIDVQDLWPEAFKMVIKIPLLSTFLFYPMQKNADFIYATADEIVAVSDTYRDRALKVNRKFKNGYSIFLGTDLTEFDKATEVMKYEKKPKDEIWIVYIGTLGNSYDLSSVIDALNIVSSQGITNLKFIVMGDGPLKHKFEQYAEKKGVNALFTGRLPYSNMVSILKSCDIAVNPIIAGSAGSIINKVGDYASAGLPVLNTQENEEYRYLLDKYKAGFNCKNGNPQDLADKILILYRDEALRIQLGQNNRKLSEDRFDRKYTYNKIVELL